MDYNQIVADKIAFLCRENHMSISQLAAACKMNRSTLENIMSGKCRKPRIQTLYKIAAVFHMSVRELLDTPTGGTLDAPQRPEERPNA